MDRFPKEEADRLKDEIAGWRRRITEEEEDELLNVMGECESPIERMLLPALASIRCPFFFSPWCPSSDRPRLFCSDLFRSLMGGEKLKNETAVLVPQAEIGSYRADFALLVRFNERDPIRLVIECDGHDFHERTKEQAAHDRRRDRALTAAGYKVFRFTGSEIYRDPSACAKEIEAYLAQEERRTRDRAA